MGKAGKKFQSTIQHIDIKSFSGKTKEKCVKMTKEKIASKKSQNITNKLEFFPFKIPLFLFFMNRVTSISYKFVSFHFFH